MGVKAWVCLLGMGTERCVSSERPTLTNDLQKWAWCLPSRSHEVRPWHLSSLALCHLGGSMEAPSGWQLHDRGLLSLQICEEINFCFHKSSILWHLITEVQDRWRQLEPGQTKLRTEGEMMESSRAALRVLGYKYLWTLLRDGDFSANNLFFILILT